MGAGYFTGESGIHFHRLVVRGEKMGICLRRAEDGLQDQTGVDPLPLRQEPDRQLLDELLVLIMKPNVDIPASDRGAPAG